MTQLHMGCTYFHRFIPDRLHRSVGNNSEYQRRRWTKGHRDGGGGGTGAGGFGVSFYSLC